MLLKNLGFLHALAPAFAGFSMIAGCVAGDPGPATLDSTDESLRTCYPPDIVRTVPANNPTFIDTPINVGFGITRVARTGCGVSCVKQQDCFVKDDWVTTCLQWAADCQNPLVPFTSFTDFASAGDAAANKLYPENNEGPSWHYLGCGPQAVMNILNYYGVNLTIDQVYQQMNTFYISSSAIATFPDDVRDGLQAQLNRWADGAFVVTRHSGVDDVLGLLKGHLAYGWPSILLVQGGNHYYTVLAASGSSIYVIDYPTTSTAGPQPGKWVDFNTIDLSINPFSQAGAALVAGVGGWLDNTVITIERTGPKPPAQPVNPFICPGTTSTYCCVNTPGDAGRCTDRNIRFDIGGADIASLGQGDAVVQTKNMGGCPNHPEQKFDFVPYTQAGAGWYQVMRRDRRLCIAPYSDRSSPDLYTIDCTDCLRDPDRCLWKFTGQPNSVFKLQNKGTNLCLYSDNGEVFADGNGPLHQKPCSSNTSDINFQRELLFFDDYGACP
jgi:hypothetical protein